MQLKTAIKKLLHKGLNKQYKKQLHNLTVSYDEYIKESEKSFVKELYQKEDYEEKSVEVFLYPELDATLDLETICGEYLLFYPMDGIISDFAKKAVWNYFKEHPECDFLYADEDSIEASGERKNPYWKPDWSPTEYVHSFYIYGVFAVRKSALIESDLLRSGNWLRNVVHLCDGVIKRAGGFEKEAGPSLKIGHISQILFHRINHTKRDKWQVLTKDWTECEQRDDLVSVIVLSKDNYALVRANLEVLLKNEKNLAYEIILVDNGSSEETKELLEAYCVKNHITYLYDKREFNFSYLCNMGAKAAKGNLLLFMNDDVEADQMNFMDTMAKEAKKPYVGAVGCKLLYPGTTKIQHAGITNLRIGPMHKLQFEKDNKEHYFGRNRKKINVIAVTAACLMIEKQKFDEVGGFSEELKVAYNDVALGFALNKAGYYNVCLNDVALYHHESLSRGRDESEEKAERLFAEQKKLYEMYPEYVGYDPFYSKRLAGDIATSRMEMRLMSKNTDTMMKAWAKNVKKNPCMKENPSVFATIEWISKENNGMIISGWSFVTGADNATFEREVWLVSQSAENTPERIYKMPLNQSLREDVARNVPNEKNVELSGFCIETEISDLLPGKYAVWILQKERFGRLRLFKKTNRSIVVE